MFRNYLAAALGNLSRNALYAGVTIAGLALAFAAAIVIGLFVRDELSYDRFIPGHDRVFLIHLKEAALDKKIETDVTPTPLADALKLDFPEIAYAARLAGAFGAPTTVRRGDIVVSETGLDWADPDFFKVLPLPAIAGDPATALAAPDAIVLTRSSARRYFGGDTPLGGVLQVDGHPMRVTAVIEDLPSNTHLAGDIFASSLAPFALTTRYGGGWNTEIVHTYVRLKPGASPEAISARLPQFVAHVWAQALASSAMAGHRAQVTLGLKPLTAIHLEPTSLGDFKPGTDPKVVAAIGAIGVLILLVAGINFVTLMTARASRRAVEVGVRKAMGAERRDLIVQFMSESFIYVAVALVLGVALAEIVMPGVNAALQRKIAFDYLHDPALLASILAGAAALGGLAGLYPALVLSAFRPSQVLKGGPVEAVGGGVVRQVLVVTQFAVLIALLVSAMVIYRQTVFALKDATHVNQDQVLLLVALPAGCTDALRDQIRALQGVKSAACASAFALGMADTSDGVSANGRLQLLQMAAVDYRFLEIYGLSPVAGRFFDAGRPADDGANHPDDGPPVVLNQAAVRALGFASPQAAVGGHVSWDFVDHYNISALVGSSRHNLFAPNRSSEIIGVAPDFTFGSVRQRIDPSLYFIGPKTSPIASAVLNIKLDKDRIAETLPAIDQVWKRISGGQPVQRFFASQFMLRLYIDTIIQGVFVAVCAIIAVSIACLGLFGLSAYTAERRTKEIGIRKAMGAGSGDILKLLLWQFARPVLIANLIAWPLAFLVMSWWLQGFVYHIALGAWTFLAAGAAAMVIAIATVLAHALRVSRAKPVGALRYE